MKLLNFLSLGLVSAYQEDIYTYPRPRQDVFDPASLMTQPLARLGPSSLGSEYRISSDERSSYPAINLTYASQVPTVINEEVGYIIYKNIRYGQPPLGDLRFAAPKAPTPVDGELPVRDGSEGHSCHQSMPNWTISALKAQFQARTPPQVFDMDKFLETEKDDEDCLFLDVSRPIELGAEEKVPVLVWFYGGGFTYGAKDWGPYSPAGLYRRAGGQKFIYIALNYRMGAYGFLSGTNFTEQGGLPNLGLYDQRLALQWVQENIEKFGGDSARVTVIGESAGAASITHQIVFSGESETPQTPPFKQAILQSPAWVPVAGTPDGLAMQDEAYAKFLAILGVPDLAGARSAEPAKLKSASRALVFQSPNGTFTVGPVVDNTAIKAHPLSIFRSGQQDKSVSLFVGSVAAEGLPFVPIKTFPYWKDWSKQDLVDYISNALPLLSPDNVETILSKYPYWDPKNSEMAGISPQTQRLADISGQALVQCTARTISVGSDNNTYNFFFNRAKYNRLNIPIAHGGDVAYTFFDTIDDTINIAVATEWQKYIMGFVLNGDPNYLVPQQAMRKYGSGAKVVEFEWSSTSKEVTDPFVGERCDKFWPELWDKYGSAAEEPPTEPPSEPAPPTKQAKLELRKNRRN